MTKTELTLKFIVNWNKYLNATDENRAAIQFGKCSMIAEIYSELFNMPYSKAFNHLLSCINKYE